MKKINTLIDKYPKLLSILTFEDVAERYSGISLNNYRASMTSYDFRSFIDFIGEDSFEIDFQPNDFDMYYPDDKAEDASATICEEKENKWKKLIL